MILSSIIAIIINQDIQTRMKSNSELYHHRRLIFLGTKWSFSHVIELLKAKYLGRWRVYSSCMEKIPMKPETRLLLPAFTNSCSVHHLVVKL